LIHRVEIWPKDGIPDVRGLGLGKDIQDLGIENVTAVKVVDVYWIDAELGPGELNMLCQQLLADSLTQNYLNEPDDMVQNRDNEDCHIIEVAYNAGVSDPVEDTIMKATLDLGLNNVRAVRTAKRYFIEGGIEEQQLEMISTRLLVNYNIQHVVEAGAIGFLQNPEYKFELKYVDILNSTEFDSMKIGQSFGFDDTEFQSIVAYFKKEGRNPSDVELETIAQTWSEHCCHKTFSGKINFNGVVIDNLLKNTIIKATKEIDKPWCLSVFKDNAGVIELDDYWALCFKVETHNHPSAVEPYGGAATGIGGVVRDVLGTGLGAKPILNTDVFCFAPPDFPYDKLPPGVLHPRRVFKGVRAGVADYANRLGIPTLNGAVLFDDRYVSNPLVFCGTVGLLPVAVSQIGIQKTGDLVVVVGGKTGRDGIHGVTFASKQLTKVSSSSVQIGNPIMEKKLTEALLRARDMGLYSRITDCGGGGLSSAIGEMAASTGVNVHLDKIPLKYSGLSYSEVWISESQERMLLAVPPEKLDKLLDIFSAEDVEATVVGEFTADQRLQLFYNNNKVCDLDMYFLHEGKPQVQRQAVWKHHRLPEPDFKEPGYLDDDLLQLLGSWDICSKEWVIRQYDHEVQGASVLKPLVGIENDGPGDAAIIRPLLDNDKGVIVSSGINHKYGEIDPYWMAASAIDEALRQVIAVGGNLNHVALLDNFCWGDVSKPDVLGALVRAAQACYDISVAFQTPFISGKDSLYNEFESNGKIISIPHTLLISAVAVMQDVKRAVSMDSKKTGDLIYIVGVTYNELGGSEYFRNRGFVGNSVPKVIANTAKKLMDRLSEATTKGLVLACHDCSEGGIGVALAEMAFAGGLGARIQMELIPLGESIDRNDLVLFSESNSRFLVEVSPDKKTEFETIMNGTEMAMIGRFTATEVLEVFGLNGKKVIDTPIHKLKEAWQKPIRW
jgi:phosphoribosylformylglycinamidine synthase